MSAGHSTQGVTGIEALKNPGICLVFVHDFAGILPVFVPDPVPGFYRTCPGAPDGTKNTFYPFVSAEGMRTIRKHCHITAVTQKLNDHHDDRTEDLPPKLAARIFHVDF